MCDNFGDERKEHLKREDNKKKKKQLRKYENKGKKDICDSPGNDEKEQVRTMIRKERRINVYKL